VKAVKHIAPSAVKRIVATKTLAHDSVLSKHVKPLKPETDDEESIGHDGGRSGIDDLGKRPE
jgi:hypothetical protein